MTWRGQERQLPRGPENLGMTDIYYLDYSENFTGVYGTLSICTVKSVLITLP